MDFFPFSSFFFIFFLTFTFTFTFLTLTSKSKMAAKKIINNKKILCARGRGALAGGGGIGGPPIKIIIKYKKIYKKKTQCKG